MQDPVMLRVYNDGHKGATALFRNRPFIDALFSALLSATEGRMKIFVNACSSGAEPYSLAMWWLNKVRPLCGDDVTVQIVATDIDPVFLDFAKQACYPATVLDGMTAQEQSWFKKDGENILVPEDARQLVQFLPPMNFVTDDPGEEFDAVLVMNALNYVTADEQSAALSRCAGYCRHVLGITAFHPDSIMADLERVGFTPRMDKQRDIHEAWGDRLATGPVASDRPDYAWRLPPYETVLPDFAYRFGALFERAIKT